MRHPIPFLLIALTLLAACSEPRPGTEDELEAVRARSEAVVAAEAAQDTEAALAYWAEDAVVQAAGSPQIQGHEAIRAFYDGFFSTGQLKHFEGTTTHMEVAESGDVAYEYGVNRMTLAGPEGDLLDVGKYLAVWKKIDREWFVAALSFTSDAPSPAPVQAE